MATQDSFAELAIALGRLGISVNEAIESVKRLQQMLENLPGPASDAKPENPNPKADLEIFEQIVVSKIEPLDKLPDWYLEML